mgnify:CR=1 FL=1
MRRHGLEVGIAIDHWAALVIDGEDYASVWKNVRRATRATTALAVAVLARAVI